MKQLAAVVAGNKLEKELYAGNDATKSINLNRIKPKRIADYWSMAFQHCGIISIASDIDCFEKCLYFSCERFGENSQNLRIDMKFEGGCPYFTNTTLGLEIDNFFTPELSMSRRMTDKIAYVGDRNSDSIFTLLFDETT